MNQRVERVAGILLAAGASTRMGKTKQLLPLGGKTLVERVLIEALTSELDKVVLVLGYQEGHYPLFASAKTEHHRKPAIQAGNQLFHYSRPVRD